MNIAKSLAVMFLSLLTFSVFSMRNPESQVENGPLRKQMHRAACTGEQDVKLHPYQNRVTLIRLMRSAGYAVPGWTDMLSNVRRVATGCEYIVSAAPILTGFLSFYYGRIGRDAPGLISVFTTAALLPIRKFCSDVIEWSETKHRDYLLQTLDYFAAQTIGRDGSREEFIDLIFDKVRAGALDSTEGDVLAH